MTGIVLSPLLADWSDKYHRHLGAMVVDMRQRRTSSIKTCLREAVLTPDPDMKYIVAALYSSYSTVVVDDTGIEQSDSYTAPPKGDKLIIRLEKLQT